MEFLPPFLLCSVTFLLTLSFVTLGCRVGKGYLLLLDSVFFLVSLSSCCMSLGFFFFFFLKSKFLGLHIKKKFLEGLNFIFAGAIDAYPLKIYIYIN
jgi:hypothetical protein